MLENYSEPHSYTYHSEDTENLIEVSVTPSYVPSKSSPKNDYYFFGYNVVIRNNSSEEVQVIGRHWIIRDGNKRERFINGEGIIGQRPKIEAGEEFTYQSFCPLSTPTGNMRGKYEVMVGSRKFWITIPLFFFRTPESFLQ